MKIKLTEEQKEEGQICLEEENKEPYNHMDYLVETFKKDPVAWEGVLANALCRAGKLPCPSCKKPTSMYGGPQCYKCFKPDFEDVKVLNLAMATSYIEEQEGWGRGENDLYNYIINSSGDMVSNDSYIEFTLYPERINDDTKEMLEALAKHYPEVKNKVLFLVSW